MNRRSFLSLLGAGTAGFALPSQPVPPASNYLDHFVRSVRDEDQIIRRLSDTITTSTDGRGYTIRMRIPQRFKIEP